MGEFQRSITSERASQAREDLQILRLEKEVAQEIVNYARNRLQEIEARGLISTDDHDRLITKYSSDLETIDEQVQKCERLIQLFTLEESQNTFIHEFNKKLVELNTEISAIRTSLSHHKQEAPPSEAKKTKKQLPTTQKTEDSSPQKPWYTKLHVLLPLIITATLLTTSPLTFGLLTTRNLTNSAGIVASVDLGVYTDSACTQNLTSIDWGIVYPGDTVSHFAYIRNLGNVNITLAMETSSWNPSRAADYISLTWSLAIDEIIQPDEVVPITLSLNVASTIQDVDAFNFEIIFTSTAS